MLWAAFEGKDIKRKSSELMNRRSIGRRSEQHTLYDCTIVHSQNLYQDCSGFLIGYTVMFRLALGHEQLNSLDEDSSGVWMVLPPGY
jgi:hypothetical protein